MNTPLVSVVMSVYNSEKYVARAINSILNQSYTHFEFIIINDGSTDASKDIIESFDDERIVFIDKKENTKLVPALNEGIDASKGKYIARMDADDESLENRLSMQVAFMEKNTDIGVLGSAMRRVNQHKERDVFRPLSKKACLEKLCYTVCVYNPTTLIRVSALGEYRYKEVAYAEDYQLWVDLAKNGVVFFNLKEVLLKYYRYDSCISNMHNDKQANSTHIIKQSYLQYYLNIPDKYQNELRWLCGFPEKNLSLFRLGKFHVYLIKNNSDKKKIILKVMLITIRNNIRSYLRS